MKQFILLFAILSQPIYAAEGIVCTGSNCTPVEVDSGVGRGLIRLRDDQKSKLGGPSQDPSNKNFMMKDDVAQEEGMDLKFSEISVGTCLIDPKNPTVYYKVTEKEESSTKVQYVAENDDHNYMLRGNWVFFKLPDTVNAFKKLRRFPCNRTPNLWDNAYVKGCTKNGVKSGDLYCNPKKKF